MQTQFPLRVAVMDDDYFALKGVVALLSRDLRTLVAAECDSAENLIQSLPHTAPPPNIILIDAEYEQIAIPLDVLIERVRQLVPHAVIVCWSQYGRPDQLRRAVEAGANSVLIKKDVRLAVATHLIHAYTNEHVVSPTAAQRLEGTCDAWLAEANTINEWQIHPDLSPRLKQVFWLCIVYGMTVKDTAAEMCVQPETVERYRMKIYDILGDGFEQGAVAELWDSHKRDVTWAFHLLTQPPLEK